VNIDDLAGSTLDRVTVDWRNGIVLATFLNVTERDEACTVRAADFSRVEVPRGASSSKRVKSASRSGDVLTIVMDSGETLRVESKRCDVDVTSG